jgi:hypothetical protein
LEKRRRKSTQTNLKQINNTKNKQQQQQINKSTKNNLKIAKNLKITNGCDC